MKSFMKGCAITALVFGVLGVVLALAGGSMAGRNKIVDVVESATGRRVHMNPFSWWGWGIEVSDEDALEETAWREEWELDEYYETVRDDDPMFSHGYDIITGSRYRYYPGEGIQGMDIEIAGCDFWTQESEDGNIYLQVVDAHRFQAYVEEDTLYIKAKSGLNQEWAAWGNIILYLPAGYQFTDVDVELGAGSCVFGNLNAAEVSLEVGAGEAGIEALEAEKLDVSVGAGNVWLLNMQVAELDMEIDMGGFSAAGAVEGNVGIECSMGSVEMTLEGREQDYNYSLDSAMGTICLGSNYGGLSGQRELNNYASREMDIECSMGSVVISFLDD